MKITIKLRGEEPFTLEADGDVEGIIGGRRVRTVSAQTESVTVVLSDDLGPSEGEDNH